MPPLPPRHGPAHRSRTVLFLLALLPVWGLLQFIVWPVVQPAYTACVARTADIALGLVEAGDRVTHLRSAGGFIHLHSDLAQDAEPSISYNGDLLHFYTVLIVSVLIVFPWIPARQRLRLLPVALACLFLFHVAAVLINVEYMYAVEMTDVAARNYTPQRQTLWRWLHHTVDYSAIEMVPGCALVLLFALRAALKARHLMIGLACAAIVICIPFIMNRSQVAARQAEKETMLAYRALGNGVDSEADRLFAQALEHNPHFAEAHQGLGLLRKRQARRTEALEQFDLVLNIDPTHAAALFEVSSLLIASGRQCDALPYLRRLDTAGSPAEHAELVRQSIANFTSTCSTPP